MLVPRNFMGNKYEIYFDVSEISKVNIQKVRRFFIGKSFESCKLKKDMKRLSCLNYCYGWDLLDITRKVKSYFERTEELFSQERLYFSPFAIFDQNFCIGGLIEKQKDNEIAKISIDKKFEVGYKDNKSNFILEFGILEDEYMNGRISFGIKNTINNFQDIYMIYRLVEGGNSRHTRHLIKEWKNGMKLHKTDIESARDQLSDYIIHNINK